MGSCVSKKAARAGDGGGRGKVAAPLPAAEKEAAHRALPPVAEVDVEEEEVKEVVLSETPAPPRPPRLPLPPEPVKPPTTEQPVPEEESASVASEACSASDTASVESAAKETAKAKLLVKAGAEREAEKRAAVAAHAPQRKGRAAPDQEKESSKPRVAGGGGNGRARSPSPSSAHRRQHQHPPAPAPPAQRPRREQPPVVSGIGCRSGRFSPSAARRAAESAVRRTHSAREADMALPSSSKRSLSAAINGSNGALSRRDAGERSGRRSDSPTGIRRAPASPSAAYRPASPMRKAAAGKEHVHGTPERARPPTRARDGDEEEALAGLLGGGERKKVEEGALGQNPSVAMECFIFL